MSVRTKKYVRLGAYVIPLCNGTQFGLTMEYYMHSCMASTTAIVVVATATTVDIAAAATTAIVVKPMQSLTLASTIYAL